MSFQKLANWFLTDKGKKFSFLAAGTVTTATLGATFIPQTIFLEEYKNIISLYKNGFSVMLTPELQNRFQKTLQLLEVKPIDYHLFKPFFSYGFDMVSAGSTYSRYGVIVGMPINFSYNSPESIDTSELVPKLLTLISKFISEFGTRLVAPPPHK